jgi:hypothetical protein
MAGLVAACGGDESAAPSGASMSAPTPAAASRATNSPPVIERVDFSPAQPVAHQRLEALVQASDPDGDAVHLGFAWRISGRAVDADGQSIVLPDLRKGETVELTVTASDGTAESAPEVARVRIGNQPPELVAVGLQPTGGVTRGQPLTAQPAATDPDGDAMTFRYGWKVNGNDIAETGPTLDTSKLVRGDTIRLRVVASDGELDSNAIESPEIRVGNAAPVIKSTPPNFGPDGTFHYAVEAVDPDGDHTLRYSLKNAPPGMTIDAMSGVVEWKPGTKNVGKFPVELVVDDLQGGTASQPFELSVALGPADEKAPVAAKPQPAKDDDEDATAESGAKSSDKGVANGGRGRGRGNATAKPSPANPGDEDDAKSSDGKAGDEAPPAAPAENGDETEKE